MANIKFKAVMSKEYTSDVPLICANAATVKSSKDVSKVVRILSQKLPVPHLQHLKRVKRMDGTMIILLDTVQESTKRRKLNSGEDLSINGVLKDSELQELLGELDEVMVPATTPLTRLQYEKCNPIWPVNFHPDQNIERFLKNEMFSADEHSWHAQCMQQAINLSESGGNAAIVANIKTKSIVATANSAVSKHTLGHACMLAIEAVAEIQRSISEEGALSKDDTPYLCTGYDVYVIREPCPMCAMALVHARALRIFFAEENTGSGLLVSKGQISSLKSLNHHYQVFRVVIT